MIVFPRHYLDSVLVQQLLFDGDVRAIFLSELAETKK